MHVTMTSGFHMLRETKIILKISMISHMSGFYLLGRGQGGVPPNVSAPSPRKKFFLKKIKSYFKLLILFDDDIKASVKVTNVISANPEHYLFQNFLEEHAPRPP